MSADTVKTTLCCKLNNKAGYILIVYSSLISFALILSAWAYLSFQENQVRQLEREISSIKAFYVAQAGLKKISYLNNTELSDPDFGAGSYDVKSENEQYISVGEVRGVKRTLRADIEKGEEGYFGYFEGAVYVHNLFTISRMPGTINGKSSYAIQSGSIISTAQCKNYRIIFKCDSHNCVIQDKIREDYSKIHQWIKEEGIDFSYINKNDNSKIIAPREHTLSKSGNLSVYNIEARKIGIYNYTLNSNKTIITSAYLTVTSGKTLLLSEGNYYLTDLILEEDAKLIVSGPVKILCIHELRLNKDAKINIQENESPGDPTEFYWIGLNKSTRKTPLPKIELFSKSEFYGTILAPYWQFVIRDGVKLEGAVFVHNFGFYPGSTKLPWNITFDDRLLAQQSSVISNWKEVESK